MASKSGANSSKASSRGLKKCQKCGAQNGPRLLVCKNQECGALFEPSERKKSSEACKLVTASSAQIYSVRLQARGPDHRGFVQLPSINTISTDEIPGASESSAICFVENCEKNFINIVLQCQEKKLDDSSSSCQHIQASSRCNSEARPLTLKNSVLTYMNITNETKQEIWFLATETPGPMVQRISKNVMAVKCKVSPKHPLGYLHFSFYMTKMKDRIDYKFFCSCSSFKAPSFNSNSDNETNLANARRCVHFFACICAFASDDKLIHEFEYFIRLDHKDLHFYRQPVQPIFNEIEVDTTDADLDNIVIDDTQFLILRDYSLAIQDLQNNMLEVDGMTFDPNFLNEALDDDVLSETSDTSDFDKLIKFNHTDRRILQECDNQELDSYLQKPDSSNNENFKIIESTINENFDRIIQIPDHSEIDCIECANDKSIVIVESTVSATGNEKFDVVESINPDELSNLPTIDSSNMIQRCEMTTKGNKKNIKILEKKAVTCAPETLKRKICASTSTTSTTTIVSTTQNVFEVMVPVVVQSATEAVKRYKQDDATEADSAFLQWLSSVTERINQTMHYQFSGNPDPLIFHVPQLFFDSLRERIARASIKKRMPTLTTVFTRKESIPLGTFTKYTWHITNVLHLKSIFETPLITLDITKNFVEKSDGTYEQEKANEKSIEKKAPKKRFEFKTYLKVGHTAPNQKQPTPFLIEWIPDILPITKIGELRLKFEFGHVKCDTSLKVSTRKKLGHYP